MRRKPPIQSKRREAFNNQFREITKLVSAGGEI